MQVGPFFKSICSLSVTTYFFLANRIGLPSPSFPSLLLFYFGWGGVVIFHASSTSDTLDHLRKQGKQAAYQGWMFSFLLVCHPDHISQQALLRNHWKWSLLGVSAQQVSRGALTWI